LLEDTKHKYVKSVGTEYTNPEKGINMSGIHGTPLLVSNFKSHVYHLRKIGYSYQIIKDGYELYMDGLSLRKAKQILNKLTKDK